MHTFFKGIINNLLQQINSEILSSGLDNMTVLFSIYFLFSIYLLFIESNKLTWILIMLTLAWWTISNQITDCTEDFQILTFWSLVEFITLRRLMYRHASDVIRVSDVMEDTRRQGYHVYMESTCRHRDYLSSWRLEGTRRICVTDLWNKA